MPPRRRSSVGPPHSLARRPRPVVRDPGSSSARNPARRSYDLRTTIGPDDRHIGLQHAIDLARRRFAEPVRVAEMADGSGLSPTQLDRALRRAIGLSPKQLLMRARLDEAVRRLEDSDLPLATVPSECGYYDQSSFTRQFQRAVGMAPGAYRVTVRRRP